jgi:glycosyltransferase involved in cell wall biosynthesis
MPLEQSVKPRRVLIIVENLPVPFDRRVWLEATTLAQNGYIVSVICPKAKDWTTSYERLEGIDIYRYTVPVDADGALGFIVEFAWCFIVSAWLSLRIALFGRGFDLIHACNPPDTFWLLGWFWRLFGRRFIFDHHDLCPELFEVKFGRASGLLYRGMVWLERRSFRAARVVITTNESHKRIAVQRGGKSPDDVFVVRSGPDLKRFTRYAPDPAYRQGKAHLLVYLGVFGQQDGVDHLVRVLKLLRDEFGRQDIFCLLVGGGTHQPVIRQYAEDQGILDMARFAGRVSDDELCRILSSATIGIDPVPKTAWSDKSTMNKIVEYMYFGLPIAAYDLHEAKVSAADAAVYAEANSEIALARAINALLDDPARRQEMAEFGRHRLETALAWEHSVAPLLAAYDKAFRP